MRFESATMIQEKYCYIRRAGKQWELAKSHHERALEAYLSLDGEPGSDECIRVPHVSGGDFVGYFSRVNEHMSRYRDESGNLVDIMMSTPSLVSHINRVVDCY